MASSTEVVSNGTRTADPLPHGIVLGRGERLVQLADFRFSIAHVFLRSRHLLTNQRLVGERPDVLFGLLPMGSETFSYSLLNMTSAGTSTSIVGPPLLIGVVLLVLGVSNLGPHWLGLLIGTWYLLLGTFSVLAAFQAVLRVVNKDGSSLELRLSPSERGKAQAFADQINAAIVGGPVRAGTASSTGSLIEQRGLRGAER